MANKDLKKHLNKTAFPDPETEAFNAYERAIEGLPHPGRVSRRSVQDKDLLGVVVRPEDVNNQEIEADGIRAEAIRRLRVIRLSKPKPKSS